MSICTAIIYIPFHEKTEECTEIIFCVAHIEGKIPDFRNIQQKSSNISATYYLQEGKQIA